MRELRRRRAEVEQLLRDDFGSALVIRYGGSKAKGTMIREAYDLDMTCYFPRDDNSAGTTIREIYESVERTLQKQYRTQRKGCAIRLLDAIDESDSHVDVVPGRFADGTAGDVFLYPSGGDKDRLKTNLDVHIAHVRESGVLDSIRLMKLWKARRALSVKTFALELFTIDLLQGRRADPMPEQLRHVWTELRDNIDSISIKDPANPEGNDLSGLLSPVVRAELRDQSRDTLARLDSEGWEAVFGKVDDDDRDDRSGRAAELTRIAVSSRVPAKPWCNC